MTMTSNTDMDKIRAQLFKTCPAKELHKDTLLFATYMDILDNRNYVYKSQNPLQIVSDSISFSTDSPSRRTNYIATGPSQCHVGMNTGTCMSEALKFPSKR